MAAKGTRASVVLFCISALGAAAAAPAGDDERDTPEPPAAAEESPERGSAEYGAVSGCVFDRDGEPLSGALVVVKGTNRFATTNAQGYYVISPAPVGTFDVKAGRVGYGDATLRVTISAGYRTVANFVLGAGPPAFAQRNKGLVEGVVVDVTGCPLNGVSVCILGDEVSARTDENGAFSIGPLAPGFYCLRAERVGHLFQTGRLLVVGGEVTRIQFVLWVDPRWTRFGL